MKSKKILICLFCLFLIIQFVGFLKAKQYIFSSRSDPSIEHRLINSKREIYALENFFRNYSNDKDIPDIANELFKEFIEKIIEEKNTIDIKGIELNDIREYPDLRDRFMITEMEFKKFNTVIEKVCNFSLPQLKWNLKLFREYIDLAKKVNYTKLEIFRDATGYEDPIKKIIDLKKGISIKRGYGTRVAIKMLRDLLEKSEINNKEITNHSQYSLKQNYPNPFNPLTDIEFEVKEKTNIQLIIYDIIGRKIKILINSELTKGKYIVQWNGTDKNNRKVQNGVYMYTIITNEFRETKKMIYIK